MAWQLLFLAALALIIPNQYSASVDTANYSTHNDSAQEMELDKVNLVDYTKKEARSSYEDRDIKGDLLNLNNTNLLGKLREVDHQHSGKHVFNAEKPVMVNIQKETGPLNKQFPSIVKSEFTTGRDIVLDEEDLPTPIEDNDIDRILNINGRIDKAAKTGNSLKTLSHISQIGDPDKDKNPSSPDTILTEQMLLESELGPGNVFQDRDKNVPDSREANFLMSALNNSTIKESRRLHENSTDKQINKARGEAIKSRVAINPNAPGQRNYNSSTTDNMMKLKFETLNNDSDSDGDVHLNKSFERQDARRTNEAVELKLSEKIDNIKAKVKPLVVHYNTSKLMEPVYNYSNTQTASEVHINLSNELTQQKHNHETNERKIANKPEHFNYYDGMSNVRNATRPTVTNNMFVTKGWTIKFNNITRIKPTVSDIVKLSKSSNISVNIQMYPHVRISASNKINTAEEITAAETSVLTPDNNYGTVSTFTTEATKRERKEQQQTIATNNKMNYYNKNNKSAEIETSEITSQIDGTPSISNEDKKYLSEPATVFILDIRQRKNYVEPKHLHQNIDKTFNVISNNRTASRAKNDSILISKDNINNKTKDFKNGVEPKILSEDITPPDINKINTQEIPIFFKNLNKDPYNKEKHFTNASVNTEAKYTDFTTSPSRIYNKNILLPDFSKRNSFLFNGTLTIEEIITNQINNSNITLEKSKSVENSAIFRNFQNHEKYIDKKSITKIGPSNQNLISLRNSSKISSDLTKNSSSKSNESDTIRIDQNIPNNKIHEKENNSGMILRANSEKDLVGKNIIFVTEQPKGNNILIQKETQISKELPPHKKSLISLNLQNEVQVSQRDSTSIGIEDSYNRVLHASSLDTTHSSQPSYVDTPERNIQMDVTEKPALKETYKDTQQQSTMTLPTIEPYSKTTTKFQSHYNGKISSRISTLDTQQNILYVAGEEILSSLQGEASEDENKNVDLKISKGKSMNYVHSRNEASIVNTSKSYNSLLMPIKYTHLNFSQVADIRNISVDKNIKKQASGANIGKETTEPSIKTRRRGKSANCSHISIVDESKSISAEENLNLLNANHTKISIKNSTVLTHLSKLSERGTSHKVIEEATTQLQTRKSKLSIGVNESETIFFEDKQQFHDLLKEKKQPILIYDSDINKLKTTYNSKINYPFSNEANLYKNHSTEIMFYKEKPTLTTRTKVLAMKSPLTEAIYKLTIAKAVIQVRKVDGTLKHAEKDFITMTTTTSKKHSTSLNSNENTANIINCSKNHIHNESFQGSSIQKSFEPFPKPNAEINRTHLHMMVESPSKTSKEENINNSSQSITIIHQLSNSSENVYDRNVYSTKLSVPLKFEHNIKHFRNVTNLKDKQFESLSQMVGVSKTEGNESNTNVTFGDKIDPEKNSRMTKTILQSNGEPETNPVNFNSSSLLNIRSVENSKILKKLLVPNGEPEMKLAIFKIFPLGTEEKLSNLRKTLNAKVTGNNVNNTILFQVNGKVATKELKKGNTNIFLGIPKNYDKFTFPNNTVAIEEQIVRKVDQMNDNANKVLSLESMPVSKLVTTLRKRTKIPVKFVLNEDGLFQNNSQSLLKNFSYEEAYKRLDSKSQNDHLNDNIKHIKFDGALPSIEGKLPVFENQVHFRENGTNFVNEKNGLIIINDKFNIDRKNESNDKFGISAGKRGNIAHFFAVNSSTKYNQSVISDQRHNQNKTYDAHKSNITSIIMPIYKVSQRAQEINPSNNLNKVVYSQRNNNIRIIKELAINNTITQVNSDKRRLSINEFLYDPLLPTQKSTIKMFDLFTNNRAPDLKGNSKKIHKKLIMEDEKNPHPTGPSLTIKGDKNGISLSTRLLASTVSADKINAIDPQLSIKDFKIETYPNAPSPRIRKNNRLKELIASGLETKPAMIKRSRSLMSPRPFDPHNDMSTLVSSASLRTTSVSPSLERVPNLLRDQTGNYTTNGSDYKTPLFPPETRPTKPSPTIDSNHVAQSAGSLQSVGVELPEDNSEEKQINLNFPDTSTTPNKFDSEGGDCRNCSEENVENRRIGATGSGVTRAPTLTTKPTVTASPPNDKLLFTASTFNISALPDRLQDYLTTDAPSATGGVLSMTPVLEGDNAGPNSTIKFTNWPVKKEAVVEGDIVLGGLMMVHEREDSITCGPVMPQGGIQALEAMLYTLDRLNEEQNQLLPNITLGAHILDDCDKDTYGLEMAVDFIKGFKFSPILADIVMNELLQTAIPNLPFDLPFTKKNVDDLLCAAPADKVQL